MKNDRVRYVNQSDFEKALSKKRDCNRESEKETCGCSLSVTDKGSELRVKNHCLDLTVKCKDKP